MKSEYLVNFDFTTVHGGGRFVGRSGQLGLETSHTLEEMNNDLESVQKACAQYILHQKPKWRIFMINITSIKPLN